MSKEEKKQVTIDTKLFSNIVIQVGILKQIYDKIGSNKQLNFFQKKVLLKNKEKNLKILKEVELVCENL